jgi:hypothetical protein
MMSKNSRYLIAGVIAACLMIAGVYIVDQKTNKSVAANKQEVVNQSSLAKPDLSINGDTDQPSQNSTLNEPSSSSPASAFDKPGWEVEKNTAVKKSPQDALAKEKRDEKLEQLNALSEKMKAMTDLEKQDPKQVAKMIAELEKITGTSTLHGVRLDVLKQNLEVAGNLKRESEVLTQLMNKKTSSTDEQRSIDMQRDAQVKKLQQISSEMNTNISVEPNRK